MLLLPISTQRTRNAAFQSPCIEWMLLEYRLFPIEKQINSSLSSYGCVQLRPLWCFFCNKNVVRYQFIVHWFVFSQADFLINPCWWQINNCLVFTYFLFTYLIDLWRHLTQFLSLCLFPSRRFENISFFLSLTEIKESIENLLFAISES